MKSSDPAEAAELPIASWSAPLAWRAIDFLSDLHLSPDTPRTLAALERHLAGTTADAVMLLGDVFEVWIGDDARYQGFEHQCLELLRDASRQRPLFFMAGNRDFLLGPAMAADTGLQLLADPCCLHAFDSRLLISHGDALCLDDCAYQAFRAQVRSSSWQQAFLARPLDERRALAREMRAASERLKRGQPHDPSLWADVDTGAALQWLAAADCQILLHGHTHRPAMHRLGEDCMRWVLSDWDFDHLGPARGDVLRWTAAGLQRLPPAC